MSEICKKCTELIPVNYCSHCGQKKARRIDAMYLKEELQYTLLHTNKGFFYTLKHLVKDPGRTVREFLEGNRVGHYKPVLLLFVLSGISVFLSTSLFDLRKIYAEYFALHTPGNEMERQISVALIDIVGVIMKYYSFITLLTIPLISIFTWLAFRKWGYNYCENFVINCYYQSLILICNIVLIIPLQYLLRNDPEAFYVKPTVLTYIVMLGAFLWLYIGLYRGHGISKILLRILILFVLSVAGLVFIGVLAGIYIAFMMARH